MLEETKPKWEKYIENKSVTSLDFEQVCGEVERELNYLKIDVSKFSHPLPQLVQKLIHFLGKYEIKFFSFSSPKRNLRALCLMDLWLTALESKDKVSLEKLKKITHHFKFISIDENDNSQLGKKIVEQSQKGSNIAQLFDPNTKNPDNYRNLVDSTVQSILANNIDQEKTKFVNDNLESLIPDLQNLIDKSGLSIQKNGLSFEAKILNLSVQELANYEIGKNMRLGWSAFAHFSKGQKTVICFCYDDLSFANRFEHETTHSFSKNGGQGIMDGYLFIMGRGMNEALTESQTLEPTSYAYPRYILEKIFEKNPKLQEIAHKVYFGKADRKELMTEIFSTYGSEGVIKFEFMASILQEIKDDLGNKILYDFSETLDFFAKNIEDPYLQISYKVKKLQLKFEEMTDKLQEIYDQMPSSGSRSIWVVKYFAPLNRINNQLTEILKHTIYLPLKYLMNQEILITCQEFLQALENFEFEEDQETVDKLTKLQKTSIEITKSLKIQFDQYFSKIQKESIFTKTPKNNNQNS